MGEIHADSEATAALLQALREGDEAAFRALFERHQSYLRRLISLRLDARVRGRLDTSDVLQETQLAALKNLAGYLRQQSVPVRVWLRRIAYQRLHDAHRRHLRAAGRNAHLEIRLPEGSAIQIGFAAGGSSPSARASRNELIQLVRSALTRLSELDREILLLRNVERLGYEEIGCVLGIDAAAARQRHVRSLGRLGKLLREHDLGESR